MKKMFIAILVLSLPYMGYAQEESDTSTKMPPSITLTETESNVACCERIHIDELPSRYGCGPTEPAVEAELIDNEPDMMMLRWPRQGVKFNREYLRNTPRY